MKTPCLFLAAATLTAFSGANAAVRFQFSGTVQELINGASFYEVNDPIVFDLTTNNNLTVPNRENTETEIYWEYEDETQERLWFNVFLTGSTGAWVDTPNGLDPFSTIQALDSNYISFYAASDNTDVFTGLTLGSDVIQRIWLEGTTATTIVSFPGPQEVSPDVTFGRGVHQFGNMTERKFLITMANGQEYRGSLDSVFLSIVPEPSSFAAAGTLLAFVLARRRSR